VKKKIEDLKILVIGDLMLDKYIIGKIERISAEAPVPIVHITKEYSTLGGCGNVINNIASLGAKTFCISQHGIDDDGDEIDNKLIQLNCRSYCSKRIDIPTISKTRVIADGHDVQMLRIDKEIISPSFNEMVNLIHEKVKKENPDIIIVSDYAKGMITKDVMSCLSRLDIKVIVDPKPSNIEYYKNVYMLTPNNKEYWEMIHYLHDANADKICEYVLHTKGKDGMVLYDNKVTSPFMNGKEIKSKPVKVFNVTGAGDTVVSIMAICTALDIDPFTSAKIANECAAYVVTQPGTSVISKDLFDEIYNKYIN